LCRAGFPAYLGRIEMKYIAGAPSFEAAAVLATVPIGKAMALFGAGSIILANVLGVLPLGDILSPRAYGGVVLAVLAFVVMSLSK
jgi:multidrug transporter EmrE-like cation transporter